MGAHSSTAWPTTSRGRSSAAPKWSKAYAGKPAVQNELLGPLFSQFANRYRNDAHRFIAEGDFVVVEARGKVTTKAGVPYNNLLLRLPAGGRQGQGDHGVLRYPADRCSAGGIHGKAAEGIRTLDLLHGKQ
jgi:hypothetical protein